MWFCHRFWELEVYAYPSLTCCFSLKFVSIQPIGSELWKWKTVWTLNIKISIGDIVKLLNRHNRRISNIFKRVSVDHFPIQCDTYFWDVSLMKSRTTQLEISIERRRLDNSNKQNGWIITSSYIVDSDMLGKLCWPRKVPFGVRLRLAITLKRGTPVPSKSELVRAILAPISQQYKSIPKLYLLSLFSHIRWAVSIHLSVGTDCISVTSGVKTVKSQLIAKTSQLPETREIYTSRVFCPLVPQFNGRASQG